MFVNNLSYLNTQHMATAPSRLCSNYWSEFTGSNKEQDPIKMASSYKDTGN